MGDLTAFAFALGINPTPSLFGGHRPKTQLAEVAGHGNHFVRTRLGMVGRLMDDWLTRTDRWQTWNIAAVGVYSSRAGHG